MQTNTATKRIHLPNLLIFLGIIFLCSAVSLVAANTAFTVADEIYQGVAVGDIPVGGLSQSQAEQKISGEFKQRIAMPVLTVTYGDDHWPISAEDIELRVDASGLAQQAYDVGRIGNVFSRMKEWYLATHRGHSVPLNISYSPEKLTAIFANIAKAIEREPRSAYIYLKDSSLEKAPEIIGRKVDIKKNVDHANAILGMRLSSVLELAVEEKQPKVLFSDLADIDGVLAMYTTQFNPWDKNRAENLSLASNGINGSLLRPGEVFSFNNIVGLRLPQYGYKEAPAYINGMLVPDWGGGVCQVTSTLYNAVLLADLGIEERTSHFRPPGYVPLGQDATVADNQIDFKFRNTTGANIYILSAIDRNNLIVNILGKQMVSPPEILIISTDQRVLEPNTIVRQDPNLEIGKQVLEVEGLKGFQVTTYRVRKIDGKEVKRELLATDEFSPVDSVVRVGTKTPPRQPPK